MGSKYLWIGKFPEKDALRKYHVGLNMVFCKQTFVGNTKLMLPDRLPGIAENAGNHGNDGKFHESPKILNQI